MLFDAPEVLKWKKGRNPFLNVLGVFAYIAYLLLIVGCVVLFGFIGAIFSLALKSK